MSIDYDMMLRTDLIVYSKLFWAYFSGLVLPATLASRTRL